MSTKISPKVTAAAAAVAAVTVVAYVIEEAAGIDIPALVEGAAAILLTFAAGYLTPDPERGRHAGT